MPPAMGPLSEGQVGGWSSREVLRVRVHVHVHVRVRVRVRGVPLPG